MTLIKNIYRSAPTLLVKKCNGDMKLYISEQSKNNFQLHEIKKNLLKNLLTVKTNYYFLKVKFNPSNF